jgi:hypothetical protein
MTVRDEIDKVIQEVYEQGVRDGMTLGMKDTSNHKVYDLAPHRRTILAIEVPGKDVCKNGVTNNGDASCAVCIHEKPEKVCNFQPATIADLVEVKND